MKRIFMLMAVLLVGILLTGCGSIPFLNGGKTEVSSESNDVESVEKKVEESKGKVVEKEEEKGTKTADKRETEEMDEEEDTDGESLKEKETGKTAKQTSGKATDKNGCENDYEDLLEAMPADFAMPDCAEVDSLSTNKSSDSVNHDVYYSVEESWKDIFKLYKEYLMEAGFEITEESKEPTGKTGRLRSKDETFKIDIEISENEEGMTTVRLIHNIYNEKEVE